MRLLALSCLLLTGCCWFGEDAPLPQPATDNGLSGAESNLDNLTDKRNSRVAAAVTVAKDISTEGKVKSELEVAQAMLDAPTPSDLAYAKDRAAKGDDAFYAKQVEVSRQLATAIIEANKRYESEKARKQAEYESRLKEKEMALAAEQEARQSDKWTYAGIALVVIGVIGGFLTPMKAAAIGVGISGFLVGSFPIVSKQPWFGYALGVILAVLGLAGIYFITIKLKPKPADETQTPQG